MGNVESNPDQVKAHYKQRSFPGSAIVDKLVEPCGSLTNTHNDDDDYDDRKGNEISTPKGVKKFLQQELCANSPSSMGGEEAANFDDEYEDFRREQQPEGNPHPGNTGSSRHKKQASSPANPTSELLARALVMEVTDNPKTMTPAAMAEREYKLLKAQEKAKLLAQGKSTGGTTTRAVGAPGGVGNPSILGSISHVLTGSADTVQNKAKAIQASVLPPSLMSQNRAQVEIEDDQNLGRNTVTIGLCLSRRSNIGHPDTVTRQTAFDFNQLQDREYKFVSSTDSSGWRAGGGERGGASTPISPSSDDSYESDRVKGISAGTPTSNGHKIASPDTVHIPIIHIDAESPQQIDEIIAALARGEIFIPHMAITPESLSVNGVSPPDLVVRFGTERNDDLPPEEWQNWCLEFMHNQLYEYFYDSGARWMKRPFSITLAKKVRWKTVKHMNRYFSHAERVIDAWREKGPQHLDPQLAYIEGGATPEEVARPHGIYLFRNGVPTNYFAPNFEPPYTTKMTRNLLLNVLGKSWDKKRREWTVEPVPRLITPGMLVTAMCGCSDSSAGGFMANEVTLKGGIDTSNIPLNKAIRSEEPVPQVFKQQSKTPSQQQRPFPPTPAATDAGATDIVSEAAALSHAESEVNDSGDLPRGFQKLQLHMSSSTHDEDEDAKSSPCFAATPAGADTPASQMSEAADRYIIPADDMPPYDPNLDISMDTGVNSSAVQPSVTNSNSTIMHTNLSADQFMKRELNRHLAREEKKEESLPSDTDWLDKLVRMNDHVSTVRTTTVEYDRTNSNTIMLFPALLLVQGMPAESPLASEQAEKDNVKAALEQERARQMALVAKAKEHTTRDQENNHQSDLMKAAAAKKSLKDTGMIYKNNSGVSLDYSIDSHSYLAGDGSTLLGGKFAADSSVLSGSSTKGSSQSSSQKFHTHRTKHDPLAMPNQMTNPRDEDEKSGFSIQESSSSMEVIPSDEDLFAVGWAKALDPRSGSYYYFTLDRAKIVWDNPLAPAHDTSMEEDDETAADDTSSLPRGAIVI